MTLDLHVQLVLDCQYRKIDNVNVNYYQLLQCKMCLLEGNTDMFISTQQCLDHQAPLLAVSYYWQTDEVVAKKRDVKEKAKIQMSVYMRV